MEPRPYVRIPGRLVIIGRAPDGDSLRFIADDPRLWQGLHRAELARPSPEDGAFQLRLEGLDAPELHYEGHSQPLAATARNALLRGCSFERIRFAADRTRVIEAHPRSVRATVYARAFEVRGRPVSYLVLGDEVGQGGEAEVGRELLARTLNHHLLATGSAYPLFYGSMPEPHRKTFREAAIEVQASRRGVWTRDRTQRFRLDSLTGARGALVFPKLFRRAVACLRDLESGCFVGSFTEWLRAHPGADDRCTVNGREARMSGLLACAGATLSFREHATARVWRER